MQYREYGKTGKRVSAFGVGVMRMPLKAGEIDFDQTAEIIRYAIDHGVNYFDSAFTYHNAKSEVALGLALEGGYREKAFVATKQMVSSAKTEDDFRRNLETTLGRLKTDFIDSYFMHNINPSNWPRMKEMNMPAHFLKFREEGIIGATGFSFHGDFDLFKEVLDYADFDMCQIQQNLLDVNKQATERAIEYAADRGMAVVIMEPLRGGGLVNPPPEVQALYNSFETKRSPVEWGFRHVYDNPGVSVVLSGVSSMDQLKENIAIFEHALPGCMSEAEKQLITKVRLAYEGRVTVPCTGCAYCMPCPAHVNIPKLFDLNNSGIMLDNPRNPRKSYLKQKSAGTDASQCVECGLCVSQCPQSINIPQQLKKVHEYLNV